MLMKKLLKPFVYLIVISSYLRIIKKITSILFSLKFAFNFYLHSFNPKSDT